MLDGRSRSLTLLGLLALSACDGGGAADAGPPDAGVIPPIELAITSAEASLTIPAAAGGALMAPAGAQYYVLGVTLTANTVGPLPIGPNAFTLRLADDARALGNPGATNTVVDGCVSQSLPLGESKSCVVVFAVELDAAEPETLSWSNGTRTLTEPVPPLARD